MNNSGLPVQRRHKAARGFARKDRRRIVVDFDQDTFDEVSRMAVKNKISFGEAVRQLVEWGLEA